MASCPWSTTANSRSLAVQARLRILRRLVAHIRFGALGDDAGHHRLRLAPAGGVERQQASIPRGPRRPLGAGRMPSARAAVPGPWVSLADPGRSGEVGTDGAGSAPRGQSPARDLGLALGGNGIAVPARQAWNDDRATPKPWQRRATPWARPVPGEIATAICRDPAAAEADMPPAVILVLHGGFANPFIAAFTYRIALALTLRIHRSRSSTLAPRSSRDRGSPSSWTRFLSIRSRSTSATSHFRQHSPGARPPS